MANALDKIQEVGSPGTATTLEAPGHSTSGTSITVVSTTNWPTATGVSFAIDRVDADGAQVAGTYTEWTGLVASATSITGMVISPNSPNADQNYSAGSLTRVYIPVSATRENLLAQGINAEHNQLDGTHTDITADSIVVADAGTLEVDTINEATSAAGVTVDGLLIKDGKVATAGAIENTAVMVGMPVQVVKTQTGAVATGTTTMPLDDTIPQNTEGVEFMTLAITPKSATNILVIEVTAQLASSLSAFNMLGAIFQDSTAGALAAGKLFRGAAAGEGAVCVLRHTMVAGTTSATTFKFRAGATAAGTTTFNGEGGSRQFGGVSASSIVIYEYKAS